MLSVCYFQLLLSTFAINLREVQWEVQSRARAQWVWAIEFVLSIANHTKDSLNVHSFSLKLKIKMLPVYRALKSLPIVFIMLRNVLHLSKLALILLNINSALSIDFYKFYESASRENIKTYEHISTYKTIVFLVEQWLSFPNNVCLRA